MSQPPYGPPGSGDGAPQYNPNTGLPENQGPETQQYGSDPYGGGQYGSQPGQHDAGQQGQYGDPGQYGSQPGQYGSQPTAAYGSDQYGSDQYGAPADPYGSGQQGQYGGDQYSSDPYAGGQYGSQPGQYGGDPYSNDQYGASAAASPYGDGQFLNPIGGTAQAEGESDKSFVVTWLLGWLLGSLGADRFYLGKIGTAIAKLLTAGGLGIWALIDLIMHLVGATRDKQGRRLAGYDRNKKMAWIVTIIAWVISLLLSIIITVVLFMTGAATVTTTTGPDGGQGTSQETEGPGQSGDGTGEQGGTDGGDTDGQQASGAAADWAESTYGSFDPVTVDGSGDEVVPVPDGVEAAIVTIEVQGDSARASSVDDSGSSAGSLYLSGTAGDSMSGDIGINDYSTATGIDVTAAGDWSVTFAPISSAPALPEAGSGSGIYLYEGDGGPVTLDYQGESNFIIHQVGDGNSSNMLVNEIDSYSGSATMDPGPSIVRVTSSGDWTITPG